MTRSASTSTVPPTLADLMVRFLASRSDAAAAAVEPGEGDVEPHEIAAGFRVDARAAWTDVLTTINTPASSPKPPADWAALVAQPASAYAVPIAAGNYPQRVRDLQPLLGDFQPEKLRPHAGSLPMPGFGTMRSWIEREAQSPEPTAALLAAGLARAIGEHDRAAELLRDVEASCVGVWRAVWENERAASLWQSGRCEEALAAWNAMADSPTASFNRGMACLFLGRSAEARTHLRATVEALPEATGWNALGRLYLAVAEITA